MNATETGFTRRQPNFGMQPTAFGRG